MAKKYYSSKKIRETDADYMLIYGQRSNGKSYDVASYCIEDAYKNPSHKFIYLRRWELETKAKSARKYFADKPVFEITGGEYSTIDIFGNDIYLGNVDEDGKIKRGRVIGSTMYLGGATHFKSQGYPDYQNVLFEECVTRNIYLPDEPTELMDIVSTVARDRKIKVFMIGNTVSRLCPYFAEWQLTNIPYQKPGTIDIYERYISADSDETIKIAVERCDVLENKGTMFFGKSAKMIVSGAWECDVQQKLPVKYDRCKKLYSMYFETMNLVYRAVVLYDKEIGTVLYVYPCKTTLDYLKDRVVTDKLIPFSKNLGVTRKFLEINKGDRIVKDLIKKDRIAFSDNLTGTEFYNIMKGVV